MHIAEFEIFAREWDAAERLRHTRLLEQLKREYQAAPRLPAAAEAPYSVRLPKSVLRQQVQSQGCPKVERSPRAVEEDRRE